MQTTKPRLVMAACYRSAERLLLKVIM